jgi:hypothetical protein
VNGFVAYKPIPAVTVNKPLPQSHQIDLSQSSTETRSNFFTHLATETNFAMIALRETAPDGQSPPGTHTRTEQDGSRLVRLDLIQSPQQGRIDR